MGKVSVGVYQAEGKNRNRKCSSFFWHAFIHTIGKKDEKILNKYFHIFDLFTSIFIFVLSV